MSSRVIKFCRVRRCTRVQTPRLELGLYLLVFWTGRLWTMLSEAFQFYRKVIDNREFKHMVSNTIKINAKTQQKSSRKWQQQSMIIPRAENTRVSCTDRQFQKFHHVSVWAPQSFIFLLFIKSQAKMYDAPYKIHARNSYAKQIPNLAKLQSGNQ